MRHVRQDQDSGYGTPELQRMQAEHERYRTALEAIHGTATVAAQGSCCLLVAPAVLAALTPLRPAETTGATAKRELVDGSGDEPRDDLSGASRLERVFAPDPARSAAVTASGLLEDV